MIGRVREPERTFEVQETLFVDGSRSIGSRYIGDNMFLLLEEGETRIKDFVEQNKEWLSDIFEIIEPWNESCTPGNCLA